MRATSPWFSITIKVTWKENSLTFPKRKHQWEPIKKSKDWNILPPPDRRSSSQRPGRSFAGPRRSLHRRRSLSSPSTAKSLDTRVSDATAARATPNLNHPQGHGRRLDFLQPQLAQVQHARFALHQPAPAGERIVFFHRSPSEKIDRWPVATTMRAPFSGTYTRRRPPRRLPEGAIVRSA